MRCDDASTSLDPLHAWLGATSQNLEALRLALAARHRDAFNGAADPCLDPSNWMARAVETNLDALLRAMALYEQAVRAAEALEDVDF